MSRNIFQPVATNAPPGQITIRTDHPVPRTGIAAQAWPISTNKFYANFFLGSQTQPTWTHPYSVSWPRGGGTSRSWGIAISHIEASQKVFGPDPNANPAQYFINPGGIHYIALSAAELKGETRLTTDTLHAFSCNVNLHQDPGTSPLITFPLVQGMGFVTANYNGGTPILQTGVFFRQLIRMPNTANGAIKYKIILEDSSTWLLYAYAPGQALQFTVVNNALIQATSNFKGTIQIAKSPNPTAEAIYDASCGAYAMSANIAGSVNGNSGNYTLSFGKGGLRTSPLVMFALPHHMQTLSDYTKDAVRPVTLQTTTKGLATAIVADQWTLVEPNLPIDMGFEPWSATEGTKRTLSQNAINTIKDIATSEISQDMDGQSNLNSFYFSGKALAKYAQICYTVSKLLNNPAQAQAGLNKLKAAFERWITNRNQYPLYYEKAWGGITSSAAYATGDPGIDFGNTNYNDHHFHYGYFILAAAYIGHLDPSWLNNGRKEYINAMVRDTANPSIADTYFPVSRGFDWYHGHSWAKGLFESADGKDQESTSEDTMFAYAIKMWGKTIGDANMEARGNLQLAINTRSINNYFLFQNDNKNVPANFIQNKVSGILFENKADHTTYFGANIEYIQGIHMIPLLPSSPYSRPRKFVQEEWDKWFSNGRANVGGGWRGILYANLALIDPAASWRFFTQQGFDQGWIDGGASRTWYLAFVAALGGA